MSNWIRGFWRVRIAVRTYIARGHLLVEQPLKGHPCQGEQVLSNGFQVFEDLPGSVGGPAGRAKGSFLIVPAVVRAQAVLNVVVDNEVEFVRREAVAPSQPRVDTV